MAPDLLGQFVRVEALEEAGARRVEVGDQLLLADGSHVGGHGLDDSVVRAGLRGAPRRGLRRGDPGASIPVVDDELDPAEQERTRRRDRDADAERRALMKPGMGKVFKQIQDAQVRAAKDTSRRTPRSTR